MATQQPLTQEKAIEYWTEYQRLISVGAYEERGAEHYETDTWPDDGIEESVHNLEQWAEKQGLEFCWSRDTKNWSLEPIEEWRQESVDEALEKRQQMKRLQGGE